MRARMITSPSRSIPPNSWRACAPRNVALWPKRANRFFVSGPLSVDFSARQVRLDGKEIKLTPTEYSLLRVLAQHAGKVVTHRQLLRMVWGEKAESQAQYLRVYVTHLRKKLEATPGAPKLIKTEVGIGYRLAIAGFLECRCGSVNTFLTLNGATLITARPCAWREIARMERIIGLIVETTDAERRATPPPSVPPSRERPRDPARGRGRRNRPRRCGPGSSRTLAAPHDCHREQTSAQRQHAARGRHSLWRLGNEQSLRDRPGLRRGRLFLLLADRADVRPDRARRDQLHDHLPSLSGWRRRLRQCPASLRNHLHRGRVSARGRLSGDGRHQRAFRFSISRDAASGNVRRRRHSPHRPAQSARAETHGRPRVFDFGPDRDRRGDAGSPQSAASRGGGGNIRPLHGGFWHNWGGFRRHRARALGRGSDREYHRRHAPRSRLHRRGALGPPHFHARHSVGDDRGLLLHGAARSRHERAGRAAIQRRRCGRARARKACAITCCVTWGRCLAGQALGPVFGHAFGVVVSLVFASAAPLGHEHGGGGSDHDPVSHGARPRVARRFFRI